MVVWSERAHCSAVISHALSIGCVLFMTWEIFKNYILFANAWVFLYERLYVSVSFLNHCAFRTHSLTHLHSRSLARLHLCAILLSYSSIVCFSGVASHLLRGTCAENHCTTLRSVSSTHCTCLSGSLATVSKNKSRRSLLWDANRCVCLNGGKRSKESALSSLLWSWLA